MSLGWSIKKRKCGLCITILSRCFLFYILKDAPLFEAARNVHSDIVRFRKENGADINKRGWVR